MHTVAILFLLIPSAFAVGNNYHNWYPIAYPTTFNALVHSPVCTHHSTNSQEGGLLHSLNLAIDQEDTIDDRIVREVVAVAFQSMTYQITIKLLTENSLML
jgi:hypothetical protein